MRMPDFGQEPQLADLPGHWIRLDGSGRVLGADPRLGARLAAAGRGTGDHLLNWLAPGSQVLWSTSLWPTLLSARSLKEVLLELHMPSDPRAGRPDPVVDDAQPMLSSWREESGDGDPTFVGLLTPGWERRRLLRELKHAHDCLESMPGAVLQLARGTAGEITVPYASSQVLDLFGVAPTVAQRDPERLLASLTAASRLQLEAAIAEAAAGCRTHWTVVLAPQRAPHQRLELSARHRDDHRLWHCVVTDVSEREAMQETLRQRAETDPLTQLPNRAALVMHLRDRLAAGRPLALLFMDCDRFKHINESLGHEAGDELLCQLAQRLRQGLAGDPGKAGAGAQALDTLTGRLGGDEFVLITDLIGDAHGVGAIADHLLHTMAQPYRLHGLELVAQVSVGVALSRHESDPEQMLRDADIAMHEAKRRGRGGWVLFEPAMHDRVARALALESDLRQALKAGQLRAAFQPIIEIATGRIVGMEALARWRHPVRGEVSPLQFVPVAEDSGLIAELGDTVLRAACTAFAGWRAAGLALPARLSVNLSRAQLADRRLPARICDTLEAIGLPCEALQLEVTESLAMDDEAVRLMLGELHALGLHLALDDFGTGHSSLATLHRFPVQTVKIDRAFVKEIETSPYHRAVIQAALQVAQALGLDVVAEGVETVAQARLLAALGCTRAQGWLYARALEAEAVPGFLGSDVPRVLEA